MLARYGRLPHTVVACVGGGSNAMGIFTGFRRRRRRAAGRRRGGGRGDREPGTTAPRSAPGTPGRAARQPELPAAGRRRPGGAGALGLGGARLSRAWGRSTAGCATPAASPTSRRPTPRRSTRSRRVCRLEGIIPALETAHAFAWVRRMAGPLARRRAGAASASAAAATRTSRTWPRCSGRPCDQRPAADRDPARVPGRRADQQPGEGAARLSDVPPQQSDLPAREREPADRVPPIWAVLDELVLTVAETDFVWEEQVVYHQLNKTRERRLGAVQGRHALAHDPARRGGTRSCRGSSRRSTGRASSPPDAGDDLLTLLWEQEFEFIQYQFIEFFGEGGGALPEQTGTYDRRRPTPSRRPREPPRRRRPRRRRRGPRASSTSRTSTRRSTSSTSARSTRSPRAWRTSTAATCARAALNVAVRPVRARRARSRSATRSSASSRRSSPTS